MQNEKAVSLILEDGHVFHGFSFGFEKPVSGEVVFNTAMMGYCESLTDPAYCGQILALTYPHIGNYGVPAASVEANGLSSFNESEKIHARALIVTDYSYEYSHWNAERSLADWLKEEQIVGIHGIDTRELAKVLREKGTMQGKIVFEGGDDIAFDEADQTNRVEQVSCKDVIVYGEGAKKVCMVDCGVMHDVIRTFLALGVQVVRVPWDYDFNADGNQYDGLVISTGPGNPNLCVPTIDHIRTFMQTGKPVYGIGMGCELLALAAGAAVVKTGCGHRGHNQPVRKVDTNTCFITAQNHGYAVDADTLPAGWKPLYVNLNDGSNEGICHESKPWFGVQFLPKASSGPTTTEFFYGEFLSNL